MKKISVLFLMLFMLMAVVATAQEKRPSPAAKATGKIGDATITIDYSSPAVKGRPIWNDLVPYGKVWRTGANEATVFTTDKDIVIEGKTLPAGSYALFTIPNEDEWVVIFNDDEKQWGAYNYKEEKDVIRVNVKPAKSKEFAERMNFVFDQKNKNGVMYLNWENLTVPVKISAAK